jgi:hypothetical protein
MGEGGPKNVIGGQPLSRKFLNKLKWIRIIRGSTFSKIAFMYYMVVDLRND